MICFTLVAGNSAHQKKKQPEINEELFIRIGNDDKSALEELFLLSERAVHAMTLSILKDPYNAQDAVQETFMKIREVSHLYRPNGKPLAWILTIAKNISLNFLRKTSRETPSQDCVPEDDLRFSCVSDPTDRLVLSTALNILSEDERQIILLHVVSGVKHMEIAKALQLPLSTVLSRYHRALKKLKKHLVGRGEF